MREMKSDFNGRRLKFARQYNEMTIGDVAKILGVSNQSISQFENNKVKPKWENIMLIVNNLNFPQKFFFEKYELEQGLANTYFRSLSSTSKKERMAQKERVQLLYNIYRVISDYIKFPTFDLEQKETNSSEVLAHYVREQWNLGDGPINNLLDVIEKHGVIVSSAFEKNDKIDAYSSVEAIAGKDVPIIVLGNETSFFRQQFNAAHELGHILTDGMYQLEEMSKSEYREMENAMNRFAGELLIPSEMLHEDVDCSYRTDLNYYIELKKKYCVSAQALIVRAKQINSISLNQYQYLMRQISARGYKKKEPLDNKYRSRKPRYLIEAMNLIKNDLDISGDEFLAILKDNELSLNKNMVENILGLKEGFLNCNKKKNIVILETK